MIPASGHGRTRFAIGAASRSDGHVSGVPRRTCSARLNRWASSNSGQLSKPRSRKSASAFSQARRSSCIDLVLLDHIRDAPPATCCGLNGRRHSGHATKRRSRTCCKCRRTMGSVQRTRVHYGPHGPRQVIEIPRRSVGFPEFTMLGFARLGRRAGDRARERPLVENRSTAQVAWERRYEPWSAWIPA
jgi:hypothetical protein